MIINRNVIFNEDVLPCNDPENRKQHDPITTKETVLGRDEENSIELNDLIEVETSQSETDQTQDEFENEIQTNIFPDD